MTGHPTFRPSAARLARLGALGLVAAATLMLDAPGARADCTDAAAPGVNWRRCIFDRQELLGVDVSGGQLREATFSRADLTGARLAKIDGYRAKFVSAILNKAVLDDAVLIDADFTKAEMEGASLRNADLRRAKMFRANLKGVDLTGARLQGTDLLNAELTGATWTDGKKICREGSVGRCE